MLFLLLGFATANAQETPVASGGNASGSGGSLSYSVGQIVYTTHTSEAGSVAQGVQQPYTVSVVSGIDPNISLNLAVYPNPTTDLLNLKVVNYKEGLSLELFDINGRLLETRKITTNETSISMLNLAVSSYLLKVSSNNKPVKTFKIIKN